MNKRSKIILIGSIAVISLTLILSGIFSKNAKEKIMYKVIFDSNGGSPISEQLVEQGKQAIKPEDPTMEGYEFVEWQHNNSTFDFNISIENDITLKAKWTELKEKVEKVTVKFNTDGGSTISDQIIEKGEKAVKPEAPQKDGYIFKGWYLNNSKYKFDTPVNENIELISKWEKESNEEDSNSNNSKEALKEEKINAKKYTIIFDSKGGSSVAKQTVVDGNKVSRPANPSKEGYTFNGWTLNGSAYNFDKAITGNITLVATWSQKIYTIKASKVDAYSPDAVLKVYENGSQITVKSIKYSDGTLLCNGTNTTVATLDIEGETNFIVVLSGGTEVKAILK